jgi:V/A-type H+-transporting ATPase subunit C
VTKYDNIEPDKIKALFISEGDLSRKQFNMLADTHDFKQFVTELARLPSYDYISDQITSIGESNTMGNIIHELEKRYIMKADTFSRLYPLSILPVLNYIIRKKIEVDNLRIIARGKSSGLTEDRIKQLLVV